MKWEFLQAHAEALFLMLAGSIVSGLAHFWIKMKAGAVRMGLLELIGECVVCVSAGMTAGLLLLTRVETPVAIAGASLASHMGTRFFAQLDKALTDAIRTRLGVKPD